MRNLLQVGSAWLAAKTRRHMTVEAVYRRGDEACEIRTLKRRSEFEVDTEVEPGWVEAVSADFCVTVDELAFSSGAVTPSRGDLIEHFADQRRLVYQVASPGQAPVWRHTDEFAHTYRIHAKLIRTE